MDKKRFGENLKRLRLAAGLTQAEVAQKLGYADYTSYQQWEIGRFVPSFEKACALADVLGVSLDELRIDVTR